MTLDLTRVVLLRGAAVCLPREIDSRYRFQQLTAGELRTLSENPQNHLAGARIERLEEGRHLCYAALCGTQLASYAWFALEGIDAESHRGRQKNTGVAISYPSTMAFMYHGFTLPEHRGQGLYGWVNGMALAALARHGIDTLLSTMDWTNLAAWQSCRRLGFVDLGLLWRWGWANWMHTHAPRQVKVLGVQFGHPSFAMPDASHGTNLGISTCE